MTARSDQAPTDKTHIPGKDAALEDTIGKAMALLEQHGFPIELVSWVNPVENCWSVHLRSSDCPQVYTNGKGGSKLASQASAVLEFFERISTNLFFADYYLGQEREHGNDTYDTSDPGDFVFYPAERWFPIDDPERVPTHDHAGVELLNDALRRFYDPAGELQARHLRDNNSDRENRGIAALPFAQIDSGETVYFPVSILNNIYVSNGMAAGNTPTECRAQALAEVLERYVKNKVIAEGLCLPEVPSEVVARYPRIAKAISELRAHGFPVLVKDASLGGTFPVICVLLLNPQNGGCYASFGASARFEVALERTVTELLQGRELDQLDVFQPPSHDLEAVADTLNLESHFIDSGGLLAWRMLGETPDHAFADWDFSGSTAEEYARLKAIISELGHDAYVAEYPFCGIYTCRIIVPGMSEIYPVDDLVWDNKTSGAALRPRLLTLDKMSAAERQAFVDELDELGPSDEQPISDLIGVLFAADTAWGSLRVGELRAMLALANRELEEAARWCQWCQFLGDLSPERQQLYRLLGDLIDFELAEQDPDAYLGALQLFFGEALLEQGRRLVSGEATFDGLTFGERWEDISSAHGQLLGIYRRLHALKAEAVATSSSRS